MNITIVLGTSRVDNVSQHVARALHSQLTTAGVDTELVTTAEYVTSAATVPPWGAGGADTVPSKWKDVVVTTDAFVFVLPEYNHSFPGEWKLLMDSLYPEYKDKRAYVAAVGGGQFAGARVMEHVMPVLVNFQFAVSPARLHVASASKSFDTEGTITDDALHARMTKFVTAIAAGV